MIEHLHPVSHVTIRGMRLPPTTVVGENDRYASTKGDWENNPLLAGLTIQPGCETVWVRPSGDLSNLSPEGKELLLYLAENKFLLAETWHWVVIPSLRWKHNGRMDWGVLHPECIPELISRGFLLPHPEDNGTYEVTEAGHEAARILKQ